MIPRNEMETIVLFTQQAPEAGFEIVRIQAAFPDVIIKRGDIEYKVEFEYKSSSFWKHKHNPTACDLIICWINDDEYPVLPVIELSNPDWRDMPIEPPPHQERLVGFWKTRALSAEKKLEEASEKLEEANKKLDEAKSSDELIGFEIPEEIKIELDLLLEKAIQMAAEEMKPQRVENYHILYAFGLLLEEKYKSQPEGLELLYCRVYVRRLIKLIFS